MFDVTFDSGFVSAWWPVSTVADPMEKCRQAVLLASPTSQVVIRKQVFFHGACCHILQKAAFMSAHVVSQSSHSAHRILNPTSARHAHQSCLISSAFLSPLLARREVMSVTLLSLRDIACVVV